MIKYRIVYCLTALSVFFLQRTQAQVLSGIATRWSDSFVEWSLYALDEQSEEIEIGELKLRWLAVREDWSDWEFQLGDMRGVIRQKWKNNPSQWELRTYEGDIISMNTAWGNDFSEWRVTNNSFSLTLKSRWTNLFDEWRVQHDPRGEFYMHTLNRQDPRDWAIEDDLTEEVSPAMRLALVFLVVYHSSPRM